LPGAQAWLTLFWQAQQDAPRDFVVGIQLMDENGGEAAYWLGRPVYSSYPSSEWVAGQIVQDPWQLSVGEDVLPGNYSLDLALYDSQTGDELGRTRLGRITIRGKK
jgi:hypothetical protein